MIKIDHVVYPSDAQMMFAIEGMRNAFNSWDKSDSEMCKCTDTGVETGFHLGEVDEALMCKLARLGSDERKFMRQMPIMMRITAPLYWWKEFDTYKVGVVSNSCSTMHTVCDREFLWDDFSTEYLKFERFGTIEDGEHKMRDDAMTQFENTRNTLNAYRHQYLNAKKKGKEDLAKDYWRQMIQLLPSSYNQTRNICMNYEVLANIYKARRAHKLKEWRDFCGFIRTLPYFNIIEASIGPVVRENGKASNEETQK